MDEKTLENINTREEEEEAIRKYIAENTDIDEKEAEELVKNLDLQTISAFEEAMDSVAKEHDRERSDAEILYDYITDKNKNEKTVSLKKLKEDATENFSFEKIKELLDNKEEHEELKDIVELKRNSDTYYYNSKIWTGQYALTAIILDEKDTLAVIAYKARTDCKIYPRPVQVSALKNPPYNLTKEEIDAALDKMKKDENYKDIGTVTASNGGVCIYSSDFMSEKYARALCEELEVEWIHQQ